MAAGDLLKVVAPSFGAATVTLTGVNGTNPTLYTDSYLTTTVSNPFTVASLGSTTVFVPQGSYILSVKVAGVEGADVRAGATLPYVAAGQGGQATFDYSGLDNRNGGVWVTSATTKAYGLAVGRGNVNVPVGTVANFFGNLLSSGTDTSGCYRLFTPVSDPLNKTILPVFNNQPNATNIVGDGQVAPNSITVACALELADGTVIPYTFNGGSHTVTITPGNQLAFPDFPIAHGGLVADAGWPGVTGVYLPHLPAPPSPVTLWSPTPLPRPHGRAASSPAPASPTTPTSGR
jgi:hypothetical protein